MSPSRLVTLLAMLLAVSVAFNLFFLGGYFSERRDADELERPGRARGAVIEELALDESQRRVFDELAASLAGAGSTSRREIADLRREVVEELGRPQPDRRRLAGLLEGISASLLRHHLATLGATTDLLEVLRPDQRERFLRLLRSTDPLGLRPHGTRSADTGAPPTSE